MPLLGSEGKVSLRHRASAATERMVPVVESCGFKPWYVFRKPTWGNNRAALEETSAWHHIEFAVPANCPLQLFLPQELAPAVRPSQLHAEGCQ